MAPGYWLAGSVAILTVVIFWAVPLILAELFPVHMLRAHRTGKPTVTTKSYQGRTVMVTGAKGAFGSRAARMFAHRDVETLVLVDLLDCTSVKDEIESELAESNKKKPNIIIWQVDMMSFASCQELAKKARTLPSLDHALMTAGILSFSRRESPEGWESSIQVNFLSSALIGLLLLPVLKSSPGNPNPPVLTFVTSFGIYPASLTMLAPKSGSYLKYLSNNKDGMAQAHQYGRSKALLLYFARELAARVSDARASGKILREVTINSADPGPAWTALTQPNAAKLIPRLITNIGARDPQTCATALVNGVSASKQGHGKIMMDFDTASYPPFMERNSGRKSQQRVWDETRQELEMKVPDIRAIYETLDA